MNKGHERAAEPRTRLGFAGAPSWCILPLVTLVELGIVMATAIQDAPGTGKLPANAAARPQPVSRAALGEPNRRHRLVWRYPRFRTWQYIASSGLTAGAIGVEIIGHQFPDHGWQRGVLFDDWVRRQLHVGSRAGRDRADFWSNISWPVVQWYPVVVDSFIVPLATDDMNWDVVAQMQLINWQVFATAGFATRLTQHIVGRSRPAVSECARDPDYSKACDPDYFGDTASFLSGHTSMTFAAAAMSCSHHAALPLYGGGIPDAVACALMLTGAATTGVLRIVADQHWPTDVLAGATIGFGVGYAVPVGLHYSQLRSAPGSALRPVIAPFATDRALGIMAFAIW